MTKCQYAGRRDFMKFIHLGDVHLGVKPDLSLPWSEERKEELWDGFRNIINVCNQKEIDLLLICGDFFHKQPLVRELKEVNYIFTGLKNTKVVIIAGNHDYISPRSNYLKFEWSSNVHMLLNQHMDSIYFEDINTEVYGFSYYQREIKEPLLDDVKINNKDRINILLAHGGTPTNIPFNQKTIESIGFDYIALGHIHKPQRLGKRIAYAGSIEPIDKTDIGKRGFIIGEIEKDNEESLIDFRFKENSVRRYININIQVNDTMTNGHLHDLLKKRLEEQRKKDIFIIKLQGYRDPDIKLDLANIYNYGNVIEVVDGTVANYDFKQLYKENKDNIIGSYISRIEDYGEDEDIKTKALYYGIEALLRANQGRKI